MRTAKYGLLIAGLWLMHAGTVMGRPVQVMDYPALWKSSTTVVIGTVETTRDAGNVEPNKGASWIPVRTTFRILLVLKGNMNGGKLVVDHQRPSEKQELMVDGPDWVQFNADKKHEYLMFLKVGSNGNYEPVSCPECMASNPFIVLQPYNISNER